MQKFDVVVVGGGLVGCAFALDLATKQHKFSIAVLEHKAYVPPDLDKLDNKIYAISPENVAYFKSIGVWTDESRIGIIKTMDVSGDVDSNIILDNKQANSVFLAKTIEYNNLQHQLYSKLKDADNVTFIYDELSEIKYLTEGAELVGKNNSYSASLVVGADGANSFVRQSAKIDLEQIAYPCSGVVANFKCELPHHNTAYQWFNNGEILAYLPLSGNKISIVWSTNRFKQLTSMTNEELSEQVATAGGHKLGKLEVITKAVAFPLKMYMLNQTYAKRMVLIGDAAHTIHPLAGQGVNLGFADARILAALLANIQGYQLGDRAVLAKYSALRLPQVRQMQLTCHMLYRLFAAQNSLTRQLRNSGLNLVNSQSWVKKYLIKQAITY